MTLTSDIPVSNFESLAPSILFVAPRFHSNQLGWVQGLKSIGCTVQFAVLRRRLSEDWTACTVHVIETWRDSPRFGLRGEWPRLASFFESIVKMRSTLAVLKASKAQYIVLRAGLNLFTVQIFVVAFVLRRKILLYLQSPVFVDSGISHRFSISRVLCQVSRLRIISPVLSRGLEVSTSRASCAHFVPFAVSNIGYAMLPKSSVRILAVGKFLERKRHVELLEIFARIHTEVPNSELTIIGEAQTQEEISYFELVVQTVQRLSLGNAVNVQTNLAPEETRELMRSHHAFVLAARAEPASVSNAEALATGLAVFCLADNGTANYVQDGHSGYICNSLGDLENRLIVACKDLDRLAELMLAARIRSQMLDPAQCARAIVRLLLIP